MYVLIKIALIDAPTEAESNNTTPELTEVFPSNEPLNLFLVSTIGGASLGLLFLLVLCVIIINIAVAVRRRKKNKKTRSNKVLHHETSTANLVLSDNVTEGIAAISLLEFSSYYYYYKNILYVSVFRF